VRAGGRTVPTPSTACRSDRIRQVEPRDFSRRVFVENSLALGGTLTGLFDAVEAVARSIPLLLGTFTLLFRILHGPTPGNALRSEAHA